jgi:RNA-directed DNA polymerase
MSGSSGDQPVAVLGTQSSGKRAGEAGQARPKAEPTVWTPRMLATLATGVKGGRWHSLIDKLYPIPTLRAAFIAVSANRGAAGVDRVTIERYASDLEANLERLSEGLRSGSYRPQAIRRHYIPKLGSQELRPLGIPTIQDRVVQTALRMVVEPIFERDFAAQSYGFRPGIGCKDALRRVDELLKAGYVHVVDADLRSYFDTIPKDRLLALVAGKVADGRILRLVEAFLGQSVLEDTQEWVPEQGTPQGAVISPLLSNIYLDPLDHLMVGQGFEMVRYADDFVELCRSPQEAAAALAVVQGWTAQAGLMLQRADRLMQHRSASRLDPAKTRLVHAWDDGFDFLGYHFERGRHWPREKSLMKLKDAIRAKTRRMVGHGLPRVIADINPTLCGWYGYFQHSYRPTFRKVDGWVRRRLRSILRQQQRTGGIASTHGADQVRWPNAYFAKHGLFSLQGAYDAVSQSS